MENFCLFVWNRAFLWRLCPENQLRLFLKNFRTFHDEFIFTNAALKISWTHGAFREQVIPAGFKQIPSSKEEPVNNFSQGLKY